MKNNDKLNINLSKEKLRYLVIFVILLGVLSYLVNITPRDEFDTSELISSNRTAIDKISREGFSIEIEDNQLVEALLNNMNENSFIESSTRLSDATYILFFSGSRKDNNFNKSYTVSALLNDEGEMLIYDSFAKKEYKGRVSKEIVKKLSNIFKD
ncbi:hypothetical protein Amet_1826 [Alkaliphilus metalliredigens QYMF]|uniref:Uncharacterized protein n=1 Tax=Alkaliphilus metalliredigens (strain QYMF) TaxID=293826 RepID=A6TP78_ALKMQ|nr:hypothetical protein [Alkaliphilus metalliredigens]ABR47996.1 hypothetical protein Amet_1826 [Alkaliphilus metalliredigens QYMF]